jgi:hypothetical protein
MNESHHTTPTQSKDATSYALIGLTRPYWKLTSVTPTHLVNYSLSLSDMNKAVAKYIILGAGSLEIIRNPEKWLCNCSKTKHLDTDLPSWAQTGIARPGWKPIYLH